ncbi:GTP pyrophosphokinase family protein [Hymenobacter sp. BT730]|uniref:GTP pyrophosphokinase n=1 Tax=Hymenobacter sp. BT730 TaxID=3063332 RepID=UPI0026E10876|nr:RelA/SpoT domain-containing protein [Hymenobacter sp. BT730]
MTVDERKLLSDFISIKNALNNWGDFVDSKVIDIVNSVYSGTNFIQMRPLHRCKNEQTFIKKALYRDKGYKSPLLEIEDKVATRVVLLTSDNVYQVTALLTECSDWAHKISKDTKRISEDNPNLFDYQSVHLVVWPKGTFDSQVDSALLTCEIQIRTLLQHAYAEVTHDSVYKGPYQNDNSIKRQLSKCMALMETTDDMFCSIFNKISLTTNESSPYKDLLKQVTALYNDLTGQFIDYKDADISIAEMVFSLVHLKPVSFSQIEQYVSQFRSHILHAIKNNDSLLVKEPIILILFYYIENYDTFVIQNWPLSQTVLENLVESLGISTSFY